MDLPTPRGVCEVDSLNTIDVMDEEAHLLKSIFKSVTEFRIAHGGCLLTGSIR